MNSIALVSADRSVSTHQLTIDGQNRSQWLPAATYRSAFCLAVNSVEAQWKIEVQLPGGAVVEVAEYDAGNLFNPTMPRYITTNAMCGLPIRFVSNQPQVGSNLWVIFKS